MGNLDDITAFAALKVLVDEQRFVLGVNLSHANSPGAPGYRAYENLIAVFGTIAAVVYAFIAHGWLIGLLSVPFGIMAFLIGGRVAQRRAGNRTRRWALSSLSCFRAMWEGGTISLRDARSGRTAISARGDDLGGFVSSAVTEVLATEGDPVSRHLEAVFAQLASES